MYPPLPSKGGGQATPGPGELLEGLEGLGAHDGELEGPSRADDVEEGVPAGVGDAMDDRMDPRVFAGRGGAGLRTQKKHPTANP